MNINGQWNKFKKFCTNTFRCGKKEAIQKKRACLTTTELTKAEKHYIENIIEQAMINASKDNKDFLQCVNQLHNRYTKPDPKNPGNYIYMGKSINTNGLLLDTNNALGDINTYIDEIRDHGDDFIKGLVSGKVALERANLKVDVALTTRVNRDIEIDKENTKREEMELLL